MQLYSTKLKEAITKLQQVHTNEYTISVKNTLSSSTSTSMGTIISRGGRSISASASASKLTITKQEHQY